MSNTIATVKNGNGNVTTSGKGYEQTASTQVQYTPRFDLWNSEHEWILYGDLPGVSADNLELHIENGKLTVHGRVAMPPQDRSYVALEYGMGDFHREFTIGEQIDVNNVSAEMKNGVLTVRLPKTEAVKPRRIDIKVG